MLDSVPVMTCPDYPSIRRVNNFTSSTNTSEWREIKLHKYVSQTHTQADLKMYVDLTKDSLGSIPSYVDAYKVAKVWAMNDFRIIEQKGFGNLPR